MNPLSRVLRLARRPPSAEPDVSRDDEVARYRHAFETTAEDRDRWKMEAERLGALASARAEPVDGSAGTVEAQRIATLEHAFTTTAADRDIWRIRAERSQATMNALMDRADLRAVIGDIAVRPPPPLSDLPDLYCVGVQKTATSYLFSVVREHSAASVSGKDTGALRRLLASRDAAAFRAEVGDRPDTRIFAHFDVAGIDVPGGAAVLRDVAGADARILICLREPVSRALSEWKMRVRRLRPNGRLAETLDFAEALAAQPQRERDDPQEFFLHFDYTGRSLYTAKVASYFDAFGRDNVKVVVMEDDLARARTPVTLVQLFNFMGLLDAEAIEIALASHDRFHQASSSPTTAQVEFDGTVLKVTSDVPEQLAIEVTDPLPELVEAARELPRHLAFRLSPDEKADLFQRHFAEDATALEDLLGRDLSIWRPA